MNLTVDTYEALSEKVAEEIRVLYAKNPGANLCIAAGHSSLGVIAALVRLYESGQIDFSEGSFTAMDEWLGMNETDEGSCGFFLRTHFLSKVNYKEMNISLADGRYTPIEKELSRMRSFIDSRNGIDYMVLGVGMNGHLALNEPGTSFDMRIHVTALDSVTKTVGKKYFTDAPELTGGLTIGIRDMIDTRRLAVVINGSHKTEIVRCIIDTGKTEAIPATALKDCEHCVFYIDQAAAELINR